MIFINDGIPAIQEPLYTERPGKIPAAQALLLLPYLQYSTRAESPGFPPAPYTSIHIKTETRDLGSSRKTFTIALLHIFQEKVLHKGSYPLKKV